MWREKKKYMCEQSRRLTLSEEHINVPYKDP
jgi:hypothetical protein